VRLRGKTDAEIAKNNSLMRQWPAAEGRRGYWLWADHALSA
jgi:hypothetical protein